MLRTPSPRRFAAGALAFFLAGIGAARVAASPVSVPDQSLLPPPPLGPAGNLAANVGVGFAYVAQTFTPAITGDLTRTELYLARAHPYLGPWEVSVRTVDPLGLPTAHVLSARTLTSSDLATAAEVSAHPLFPVAVNFDTPAPAEVGRPLALVVRADGTTGGFSGVWYGLVGNPQDPYPRGAALFGNGTHWSFAGDAHDLFFRTFVTPVPEPTATLALAAAAAAVFLRRRRRP